MDTDILTVLLPIIIIFAVMVIFIIYRIVNEKKEIRRTDKNIKKKCKNQDFQDTYNYLIEGINISEMKKWQNITNVINVCFCTVFSIGFYFILFTFLFSNIYNKLDFDVGLVYLFIIGIILILFIILVIVKKKKPSYDYIADDVMKKIIITINPNVNYKYNIINEDFVNEIYSNSGFRDGPFFRDCGNYIEYDLSPSINVKMLHISFYSGLESNYLGFCGIVAKVSRENWVENEILKIEKSSFIKWLNNIKCLTEFEKYFDLKAQDKQVAKLKITQAVQLEILKLYKEHGIMFEISLKGKFMYIRFFTKRLFNEKVIVDKNKLQIDYTVLCSILEIIETLSNIL